MFNYQQVENWSLQELFNWIHISSKYEALISKN